MMRGQNIDPIDPVVNVLFDGEIFLFVDDKIGFVDEDCLCTADRDFPMHMRRDFYGQALVRSVRLRILSMSSFSSLMNSKNDDFSTVPTVSICTRRLSRDLFQRIVQIDVRPCEYYDRSDGFGDGRAKISLQAFHFHENYAEMSNIDCRPIDEVNSRID